MTWATNRRKRLPANWETIRRQVFERDGYRCTVIERGFRCPAPAEEVDHVHRGDDHSLSNLASICGYHHGRKSAREGNAARRPAAPLARPAEPHPGLIA